MFLPKMEISFWRHKSKRAGMATLYCRITVGDGQQTDICSTGITIDYNHWDAQARCVTGDDPQAFFYNDQLDILRTQLRAVFNDLYRRKETITGPKIKRIFLGKTGSVTLLSAFDLYLEDCRTDRERDLVDRTITGYTNVQKKLAAFLKHRNATDLLVEDFDLVWVKAFRKWMKQVPLEKGKIGHENSYVAKQTQTIKNVLTWAKLNKVADQNPLDGYKITGVTYPDPDFLTEDEFQALRRHRFANPYMQQVADVFIVLCRSGFHYGDLVDFVKKHKTALRRGIDGEPWVIKQRIKTEIAIRVPVFDEVQAIVDKYNGWEGLPLISLAKFNQWLKLVAAELKFHPDLSSKAGRKTFTDWCFNTLHLTTDSVVVLLGRKTADGLEVYGRPDERRVAAELRGSEEMQERKRRKAS